MPWSGLICGGSAVVSSAEILTTLWIVAFDLHVGITESHLDHGAFGAADIDGTLLLLTRSVKGFIESDLLSLVFWHQNRGLDSGSVIAMILFFLWRTGVAEDETSVVTEATVLDLVSTGVASTA